MRLGDDLAKLRSVAHLLLPGKEVRDAEPHVMFNLRDEEDHPQDGDEGGHDDHFDGDESVTDTLPSNKDEEATNLGNQGCLGMLKMLGCREEGQFVVVCIIHRLG